MDDLGFNKVAGAVLATALGMLVLMKLPSVLMPGGEETIAYKVGPIAIDAATEEVDLPFPQADWVAAMDEARGAKVFKKCTSCHNVEEGGANGTGPALYGVVGAEKGAHEGFNYSTALAGVPGGWTYESLDAFLEKPSAYAPGTKMNFIGLKKPADRAAVIEYLRVNGSSSMPRPESAAVELEVTTDLEEPVIETEERIVDVPEPVENLAEGETDETETEPGQ